MPTSRQQAEPTLFKSASSLDRPMADDFPSSPLARNTSVEASTAALAELARLLGRAAAANHHRRRRGYSLSGIVVPLGIVAFTLALLLHVLALR